MSLSNKTTLSVANGPISSSCSSWGRFLQSAPPNLKSLEGIWYKLCRQSGTMQVFLRCLIFFFFFFYTTAGDPSLLGTERFAPSFHILFPFVNRFLCLCISTYVFHTWQLSYCVILEKPHPLSWSLYSHLWSWSSESCVINHERHGW